MKNYLRTKLKRALLKVTGRVGHLKKNVFCEHIWYGKPHSGFYVHPNSLNKDSVVYSFGIGEDISFDREIIENHNVNVFGFDPTPKSIAWLKNQDLPKKYRYFEFGIGKKTGFVDFYLPKNPNYVSGSMLRQDNVNTTNMVSVEMKSFKDIVNELGHAHIDVLKMDIEGAEYEVIEDILNQEITINQILIEFHDRFFSKGVEKSKKAIGQLRKNGFEIFAVSENFEEISLINKKAI